MTTRLTDRQRRGNAASIFGLLLPTLMGSVAMGVDWGAVAVARLQVQAAADAASVAATTDMQNYSVANARAVAYASAMTINGVQPTVTQFDYGFWNGTTFGPDNNTSNGTQNSVRVRTQAILPMSFAWILGVSSVTVRAESGAGPAVIPKRAPDHVLALDVTCSMSEAEVGYEVDASLGLLECVKGRSDPTSRGAAMVFTGLDAPVVYELVEYSDNDGSYTALFNDVESILKCGYSGMPDCSTYTDQASGYEAALEILRLGDATRPSEVGQVIVLMSDGEPDANTGYDTSYPCDNPKNGQVCAQEYYDEETAGVVTFPLQARCTDLGQTTISCRRNQSGVITYTYPSVQVQPSKGWAPNYGDLGAWVDLARATADARGVDVYTVYYGTNTNGSDFLNYHVRTGDGTHNEATSRAEVIDVFEDICVQFTGGTAGMLW